jgi:hypothetical protein
MFGGTLEVIPFNQQKLLLTAIAVGLDVDTNHSAIPLSAVLLDPIFNFITYSKDAVCFRTFGNTFANGIFVLRLSAHSDCSRGNQWCRIQENQMHSYRPGYESNQSI